MSYVLKYRKDSDGTVLDLRTTRVTADLRTATLTCEVMCGHAQGELRTHNESSPDGKDETLISVSSGSDGVCHVYGWEYEEPETRYYANGNKVPRGRR